MLFLKKKSTKKTRRTRASAAPATHYSRGEGKRTTRALTTPPSARAHHIPKLVSRWQIIARDKRGEREGREEREREKAATVRNILVENEATAKDGRERWKKDAGNTKARKEKE